MTRNMNRALWCEHKLHRQILTTWKSLAFGIIAQPLFRWTSQRKHIYIYIYIFRIKKPSNSSILMRASYMCNTCADACTHRIIGPVPRKTRRDAREEEKERHERERAKERKKGTKKERTKERKRSRRIKKEERRRLQLACRELHKKEGPHAPTQRRPRSKKSADWSAKLRE